MESRLLAVCKMNNERLLCLTLPKDLPKYLGRLRSNFGSLLNVKFSYDLKVPKNKKITSCLFEHTHTPVASQQLRSPMNWFFLKAGAPLLFFFFLIKRKYLKLPPHLSVGAEVSPGRMTDSWRRLQWVMPYIVN